MGSHEVGRDGSSAVTARGLCGVVSAFGGRGPVSALGVGNLAAAGRCNVLRNPMIAVA